MEVGYARTSTVAQEAGFEAQIRDLKAAGVTKLFQEQVSSVAQRQQLNQALGFVREGDSFIVTKLDRLARSTKHLMEITSMLEEKGVKLKILNMGLDTSTPTGRMILTTMGAMAQFEREMMLERQREGIAKAMREGRMKGRPKVVDVELFKLYVVDDSLTATAAAKKLGISRGHFYRMKIKLAKGEL